MNFRVVGRIRAPETFAVGSGIKELGRLRRTYGEGNWRKRKGFAAVQFNNGIVRDAEVHWYEANGIGRKEIKVKRFLD